MTGRITRLIDDQQAGTIAGEDGVDYGFRGGALIDASFGSLHIGARVTFVADELTHRAAAIRVAPTNNGRSR
jgi:hypothetical protein